MYLEKPPHRCSQYPLALFASVTGFQRDLKIMSLSGKAQPSSTFSCPSYTTIFSSPIIFSDIYSLLSLCLGLSYHSSSIKSYFSMTAPLFPFNHLIRDTSRTLSSSCTLTFQYPNRCSGFRNCFSLAIVLPAERALGIPGSMVNACC